MAEPWESRFKAWFARTRNAKDCTPLGYFAAGYEESRTDLTAMEKRARNAEERATQIESILALLDSPILLEQLAAWEHDEHWAGWEKYRAEKEAYDHPSGEPYVLRWKRQRETKYADLPEAQRESDREEVRHYLAVIRRFLEAER